MSDSSSEVAVLLCTFDGARFLEDQLHSLFQQDSGSLRIYASDDGSADDTVEILQECVSNAPLLAELRKGPGRGAANNFLSLICEESIQAEYFAYSDQDDIWDSNKISRALSKLAAYDDELPVLYCARTRSLSGSGQIIGASPVFAKPASFANALVQNIGGGNTMVMNRAARDVLRHAGPVDVVSHDWWTYLLISGAGGVVIYDPEPCLSYRQHADNQIGANVGVRRRIIRYLGTVRGRNRDWNDRNIAALERSQEFLTKENRETLRVFSESRSGGIFERLCGLKKAGLYAQTFSGNLGLFLATLLKKI